MVLCMLRAIACSYPIGCGRGTDADRFYPYCIKAECALWNEHVGRCGLIVPIQRITEEVSAQVEHPELLE